jgi:hypothetical protein
MDAVHIDGAGVGIGLEDRGALSIAGIGALGLVDQSPLLNVFVLVAPQN